MTLKMGDNGGGSGGGGHGGNIPPKYANPWGDVPNAAQRQELPAVWLAHLCDKHKNDPTQPPGARKIYLEHNGSLDGVRAFAHGGEQHGEHGNGGGGVPDQHAPPSSGNSGTVQEIINFFRSKGLNDNAIAGILGNWRVESNFNTSAYNAGEGAIGLAQWEGGRRSSLQAYAAAHGMTETDLGAQLGFAWHELTTGYSGVLQQLQGVNSATEAANIWNRQFEVSGDYTNDRENYASQFLSNGFKGIANIHVGSGGTIPGGGGGGTGSGGGGGDPAALNAAMDQIAQGLSSVPALHSLLQQAINQGWTPTRLQQAVTDSPWYKTHSATARSIIAQQLSDPKTYQQRLDQTVTTITSLANQDGWDLTPDQAQAIAHTALMTGNDTNQNWLTQAIGHRQFYGNLKNVDSLQGGMAQTANQLQQIAASYGYNYPDPARIAHQAKLVLEGVQTVDTYTNQMKEWAKSAFPGLSHQIDQGQTVADVAQPYISSMSNLLEVSPNQLNLNTPLIRKALQGNPGGDGKGAPTAQPLWAFENQVRQDPRWQFTSNAHQQASTMLLGLGRDFGFAS